MADSRVIAWGLLVVTALLVWLAFWPGLITPDSNQTIYQAITRQYTNWWTPFGAWLLHQWLHLGLGLGGVFAIGVGVVVCGMYLCARFCFRRVPAAVVALISCLLPPVYGDLSGLSRDVFFLGFAFLGFGLLGRLAQGRDRTPAASAWLGIAAVASEVAAYLCRQNALACVFALMLGVTMLWRRRAGRRQPGRAREVLLVVLAALAATAVVGFGTLAGYAVTGVRTVSPQRFTYVYDLASISVLSHHDRFPRTLVQHHLRGGVSPPYAQQANLIHLFDPTNVITLYPNNAAAAIDFESASIASRETALLKTAWLKAIESEPLDYAWGRIRLLAIQLGFWRHPTDAYIPLLSPNNYGYPLVFPGNYRFASRVLGHFVGPRPTIPLDIPWTWLLVIVIATALLFRWLGHLAWHLAVLPVAVAINYLLLLFASMAAGFRYVSFEVPVAVLVVAAALAVRAARGGRARGLVDPSFQRLAGAEG